MSRQHQKQIWADEIFIRKLEELKAKKLISGEKIGNIGEITRMIASAENFTRVEKELLESKRAIKCGIRFDERFS